MKKRRRSKRIKMKKEAAFEKLSFPLLLLFFFIMTNLVAVVNSWHMLVVAALMLDEAVASWRNCYSHHFLEQKSY